MPKLRLLEVSGSPFEMGRQHASAYPLEIRKLTEDHLQLSSNKNWAGKELSRQEVRDALAQSLSFPTLTISGCMGMMGMNEAGIAVSINNWVVDEGQVSITWPLVIHPKLVQNNSDDGRPVGSNPRP